MIRSKYIGRKFENWVVTKAHIAGRYGKRNKAKGNSYCFTLSRPTSDSVCSKSIVISHNAIVALSRGLTTVSSIIEKQSRQKNAAGYKNAAFYRFLED